MATPIRIKRSAVSGKRPQLTDLQVGELALNTYDGSLFTERDTGGVGIATTVSNLTPWTESYGASSISYLNSVGIGTTNPTNQLHITGPDPQIKIEDSANGHHAQIFLDGPGSNLNFDWVSSGDRKINFINSGTDDGPGSIRVGIGTTNPVAKLDVAGKILAGDSITHPNLSNTLDKSAISGVTAFRPINLIDTSSLIKLARLHDDFGPGLDLLSWDANLTTLRGRSLISLEDGDLKVMMRDGSSTLEKLRIASDGKVGIGTTNPSALLHLHGSSPKLYFTDTDTNVLSQIDSDSGGGNFAINVDVNNNAGSDANFMIRFNQTHPVSDAKFLVKQTGDVGIGTHNPTGINALTNNNATLAVGVVTANTIYGNIVGGIATATSFESTVATGTAPFTVASTTLVTNLNADLLDGKSTANSKVGNTVVVRNAAGGFTAGDVTFDNVSVGGTLTYEDVTNVDSIGIITSRKDVHVGAGLSVVGISTFNDNVRIGDNASFTASVNGDNLVIGSLSGNHGVTILSNNTASNNAASLFFGDSGSPIAGGIRYFHASNYMMFRVAGGERVRITGTGRVGINSTSPSHRLEVVGDSLLKGDLNITGISTHVGFSTFKDGIFVAGVSTFSDDINVDSGKTLTLNSDASNPVIKIQGSGPNFITFATDTPGNVNADSINLVYRTTPNTLGFERASDNTIFFTVDADDGLVTVNNNLNVSGVSTFSERVTCKNLLASSDGNTSISILDTGHGFSASTIGVSNGGRDLDITAPRDIRLKPSAGLNGIVIEHNGPVELYHDNNKKAETSTKGIKVGTGVTIETNGQATFTGIVTATGADINGDLDVSGIATIGTGVTVLTDGNVSIGGTLELFNTTGNPNNHPSEIKLSTFSIGQHNNVGTMKIMNNNATGTLIIGAGGGGGFGGITLFNKDLNAKYLQANNEGSVDLFHNNNLRFRTTGIGVSVLGITSTTHLNVTGVSTFNDNAIIDGSLTVGNGTNITGGAPTDQGNLAVYGVGKNSLIIQATNNGTDRGMAFRNTGDAYVAYIAAVNRGSSKADLRFGVGDAVSGANPSVDSILERMRITKEGNVGINTTTPTAELDVDGSFHVSDNVGIGTSVPNQKLDIRASDPRVQLVDTDNNETVQLRNSQGNCILSAPGNTTFFTGSGGEKFRIKSDGNVGIGTKDPTEQLHLAADSAHQILLKRSGASPSEVTFGNEGNTARISNNTNGIDLRTGLTPSSSMLINRDGDVGIGTDDPSGVDALAGNTATLAVGILTANTIYGNVVGGLSPTGNIFIGGNLDVDGTTDLDVLNVSDTATFTGNINANGNIVGDNQTAITGILRISGQSAATMAVQNVHYVGRSNDQYGYSFLHFNDQNVPPFGGGGNFTTLASISGLNLIYDTNDNDTNGFVVGVGSTNVSDANAFTAHMVIDHTGEVGFGTNNPESKLHISGTGANEIRIDTNATGLSFHNYSEFIGFMGNDSGNLFINAGGTQDTLSLQTGGTEALQINNSQDIILKKASIGAIHRSDTSGAVYIAAGSDTDVGGNINLFGSTHATLANHIRLRNGATVALEIDANSNATFAGNVSIAGTLTYEDVTNIDSIGIITARNGIHVTGAGVSVAGISKFIDDVEFQGKVGIGTTDPKHEIHIQDNTPTIRLTKTNGATDSKHWNISAAPDQILRIQGVRDDGGGGGNYFDFYRNGNQVTEFRGSKGGNLWFVVGNHNRRVGIGSTTPTEQLDVAGNTKLQNNVDIDGNLIGNGNVGFGTVTNSDVRLKVTHDGLDEVIQQWGGYQGPNAGHRFMELYSPANDVNTDYFRFKTGNAIKFQVDSIDALCINSDGKVGIGTESIDAKLHVEDGKVWIDNDSDDTTTRANGLTVSHTYNPDWSPGTDPGDARRIASFIVTGATKASIITLRNLNKNNAFFDFIADGTTDKFYVQGNAARAAGLGPAITLDTSNNIGINSTIPETKLDVIESSANRTWTPGTSVVSMFERVSNSRIAIVAGSSSYGEIDFGDSTDDNVGYIRYDHADNSMSFRTNTSEKLRIASGGQVGIGTTNLLQKLNVYNAVPSNAGGILVQNVTYAGGVDKPYLIVGTKNWTGETTNWNTFGFQHRIKSTSPGGVPRVTIDSANGELFSVDNSGRVGIRTEIPKSHLEVTGSAAVLTITDTRNQIFNVGDTLSSLAFDTDDLSGGAGSASHPRAKINLVTENTFGSATGLSFATKADTGNAPEERLRITSAGNVGIGSTIPAEKLDVAGHIKVDGGPILETSATYAPGGALRITSPSGVVEVGAQNASYAHFITNKGRFYFGSKIIVDEGIVGSYNEDLVLMTNIDDERIRIKNDTGNVGIGTDTPDHQLHVVQKSTSTYGDGVARFEYYDTDDDGGDQHYDARFIPTGTYIKSFVTGSGTDFLIVDADNIAGRHSFAVEGNAGDNKSFTVDSTGLVGIGTDNPGELLDVYKSTNDAQIKVRTKTDGAYFVADSGIGAYYGIKLSRVGTQKWFLGSYNSENFQIKDGSAASGDERFTIQDSTGYVGIGTDDPDAKLDVNVGSSVTAFNVSGSEGQLFSVTNNLSSGSIFSVNDISGSPSIDVDADGTIQLAPLLPDEKVGIGTTNPASKLHVFGNLVVGHGDTHTPSGLGTDAGVGIVTCDVIHLRGGGFVAPVPLNSGNQVVNDAAIVVPENFHIYNLESDGKYFRNLLEKNSNIISLGQDATNTISKIRIKPGNLKNGNVELYNDDNIILSTSDTGVVVTGILTASSQVAIGTDNPGASLHVYGTDSRIRLSKSNAGTDLKHWDFAAQGEILRLQAKNDAGAGGGNLFDFHRTAQQVNEFRGVNSGNTWFVVDNLNQKVGIGTDDPQGTLQVGTGVTVYGNAGIVSATQYNGGIYAKFNGPSGSTANINTATTTVMDWLRSDGLTAFNKGGFTNTTEYVTVPVAGLYQVTLNGRLECSNGFRSNVRFTFTQKTGPTSSIAYLADQALNNYIRVATGHQESSVNLTAFMELEAGAQIGVETLREADSVGTVTLNKLRSSITFLKVA